MLGRGASNSAKVCRFCGIRYFPLYPSAGAGKEVGRMNSSGCVEAGDRWGDCGVRYLLLILPSLAAVWAPFYNSVEPRLFGVPFFYWFLLALVPVSSVFIYLFARLGRP
jgi:hypothetical protein